MSLDKLEATGSSSNDWLMLGDVVLSHGEGGEIDGPCNNRSAVVPAAKPGPFNHKDWPTAACETLGMDRGSVHHSVPLNLPRTGVHRLYNLTVKPNGDTSFSPRCVNC